MSRRMTRRLLVGGMLLTLTTSIASLASAPAQAAEEDPPREAHITIEGDTVAEPVTVSSIEHPERYRALRGEMEWLVGRDADASEPDQDALGPQYVAVMHVEGDPRHRFDLYPLADGGPRVYRPADQPNDRSVDEAWFFGRLSLPESLRETGVPLEADAITGGGGIGGDGTLPTATAPPDPDPLAFMDELRESLFLTTGAAAVILAGLASVAFLLRREGRDRR